MKEMEKHTCLRFAEGCNQHRHYINITNYEDGGCIADIGYAHKVGQLLNLALECMYKGHIMHEFGHALGFQHQQNVPDRDNYVNIHFENMDQKRYYEFRNMSSNDVIDFGLAYDYRSIMHYRPYEFSNNGKPTITAKHVVVNDMGQREGLTSIDVTKINKLYNCKDVCNQNGYENQLI